MKKHITLQTATKAGYLCLIISLLIQTQTALAQTFTNAVDGNISNLSNWTGNPMLGGTTTSRWNINGTTEYTSAEGNTTINNSIGLIIGLNNGSSGNLTISGGNLTINNNPGGSVGIGLGTNGDASGDADATLILDGGNLTIANAIGIASRGTQADGLVIIRGGSTLTSDLVQFGDRAAAGNGTLTIESGGTLLTRLIEEVNATTDVINFDGGTLKSNDTDGGGVWMENTLDDVNILANGATFDSNGQAGQVIDAILKGVVGGNVTIIDSVGGGEVIFGANNTYDGDTIIASTGTLILGNGGTSGTAGTGAITNNGTLVFNRSDDLLQSTTTAANISGGITSGNIEQRGSGTLTLDVDNTYSGTTLISGGTLQIGNGGTSGSLGTGSITNNSQLTFNRSDSTTVSNDISGSGAVTFSGGANAASLTLSGNNSYDGATTVTNGTIVVGSNTALGSAVGLTSVQVGDAALQIADGITVTGENLNLNSSGNDAPGFHGGLQAGTNAIATWAGNVTITGGGARIGSQAGGHLTISGDVGESGGSRNLLISAENSTGKVTFSGSTSYTGQTRIGRGTLLLGKDDILPTTTTLVVSHFGSVAGAKVDLNGFNQTVGRLINTNASAFVMNNGATSTLTVNNTTDDSTSITFSGNLALIKSNTGNLTLTSASSHSGDTRVAGGELIIGNADALSNSTLNMVSGDTGVISFNQDPTLGGLKGDRDLDGGGFTLSIGNNNEDTDFSGNLSNAALTKIGSGTLTLSGTNGFSGNTIISNGILQINNADALANSANITASTNGTLLIDNGTDFANDITIDGAGFGGVFGALQGGTSPGNRYSGSVTVASASGVRIGISDGNNLEVAGNIIGNRPEFFRLGNGSVLTISGNGNSYTGNVNALGDSASTSQLIIGANNTLPTGSGLNLESLTLDMNGFDQELDTLSGLASANVTNTGSSTSVLSVSQGTLSSGILDGSGGIELVKNGTGTFTLDGLNTYSGNTTINAGFLTAASDMALGTSNVTVVDGATLLINQGANISNDVTITGPGVGGARGALRGGTSGSNVFSGELTISGTTARIGTQDNGNLNVAGNIIGKPAFFRPGTNGTLTISGSANNYTGSVSVFGGAGSRVVIGRTDTLPTTSGLNINGATLDLNGFDQTLASLTTNSSVTNDGGSASTLTVGSGAISGVISDGTGNLGIAKQGTGTSTFSESNTYTGGTAVSGGTLLVNNTTGSGTGTGTVSVSGGALGGTGTISGATEIQSGGTLGASNTIDSLTFTGGLDIQTGSTFSWNLIDDSTSAGDFDAFTITGGTFTIGAGSTFDIITNGTGSMVDYSTAFWNMDRTWIVIDYTGLTAPSNLFSLGSISNDSMGNSFNASVGSFALNDTGNGIELQFTTFIPEPSTYAIMTLGLAAFGWYARRRRLAGKTATE